MKDKEFKPYDVDINYEYTTYKYVGKDYGNRKTDNQGMIFNFLRACRKLKNRKEEKYMVCHRFSDWEEHVKKIGMKKIVNKNDMLRWLYKKQKDAKNYVEAIKIILIPIYISIIPILHTFFENFGNKENASNNWWIDELCVVILLFVIVAISAKEFYDSLIKVSFFEDFIKIIEDSYKEEQ